VLNKNKQTNVLHTTKQIYTLPRSQTGALSIGYTCIVPHLPAIYIVCTHPVGRSHSCALKTGAFVSTTPNISGRTTGHPGIHALQKQGLFISTTPNISILPASKTGAFIYTTPNISILPDGRLATQALMTITYKRVFIYHPRYFIRIYI
jgi:hypothetical protein